MADQTSPTPATREGNGPVERHQILSDEAELSLGEGSFPLDTLTARQAYLITGFEVILKNAKAGDGGPTKC